VDSSATAIDGAVITQIADMKIVRIRKGKAWLSLNCLLAGPYGNIFFLFYSFRTLCSFIQCPEYNSAAANNMRLIQLDIK